MGTELVIIESGHRNVGDYCAIARDTNDTKLIALWLDGKAYNTQVAYERDIQLFQTLVNKPIQDVLLEDVQTFGHLLTFNHLSSKARARNAVKSLFSFALRTGYIRINPAAAWRTPKTPDTLAERIMTQEQVYTVLANEKNARNHVIIRLLYNSAIRVSELCSLTWKDVQTNALTGGQITVFGKESKTRSIPISRETYGELLALRGAATLHDAVFVSFRSKKPLDRMQVFRIVQSAAHRAGIEGVSPHWMRHAHASHALDENAPIQLVKETLGHANIVTTNNYAHAKPNASSSTYLKI